jgi:hypothetical protein
MKRILLCCLLALAVTPAFAQLVPTQFVRDRIFVVARDPDGKPLRFFTDTGGGWNAIGEPVVDRLQLAQTSAVEMDDLRAALVDFPDFLRKAGVPEPLSDEPWLHGKLVVAPPTALMGADGVLGSRWFAGRVWDIDYGSRTMRVLKSVPASAAPRPAALGFRSGDKGERELNFPRIAIAVEGRQIDMLLDTGATARPSQAAAGELGVEPGASLGTSFVIQSIFNAWKTSHPDWRIVENADVLEGQSLPMIQVPQVSIGGVSFGPVWFTQRPDPNFLEFMSQMTDQPVSGAIGGSALRYLRVVLDYPGGKAYVRKSAR